MLVEDNSLNQEMRVEIRKNEGIHVDLAYDGQVAVTVVQNFHYDTVLMGSDAGEKWSGYGSGNPSRQQRRKFTNSCSDRTCFAH